MQRFKLPGLTLFAVALALAVGAATTPPAEAQEEGGGGEQVPSVEEIVEKANHAAYYQGATGRAYVTMTIYNARGEVRGSRELIILRRNVEETLDQKYYAYIKGPPDVRGTVFLVWKHTKKPDDRWLYNPGLDLVNRISARDKRTSFVGTHFFYEDVSGRNIHDDEHELLEVTDDYYILKNTPKDPDLVEFSYYKVYVHRKTWLPLYVRYYNDKDEMYREYRALAMPEKIHGHWTITKAAMRDLRAQGPEVAHTVADYSDIEYGIDLPDDIFSERYMRQPPREYLQ